MDDVHSADYFTIVYTINYKLVTYVLNIDYLTINDSSMHSKRIPNKADELVGLLKLITYCMYFNK